MQILKTNKYWNNVESAYKALGGTYKVVADKGSKARVPADPARYTAARLLAYTGKRVCAKCAVTHEGEPGEVYRHCGTLMHADMTVAERSAVMNTVGKLRVKKTAKDELPGGKADNIPDSKFNKKDLEEGSKHEKEHTKDPDKKKEIAKDHLVEDTKYYDKLKKMEKNSQQQNIEPMADMHQQNQKNLTATFIKDEENLGDSHWVIKAGTEPVLKVTLSQAFPNNVKTKAAQFSTDRYGETLLKHVKDNGVERTVKAALNGRATMFKAGQINPLAPNIFQDETSIENQDQQGEKPTGDQADDGLVGEEVGDGILDEKDDNSDIIETIKESLVPIIKVSEDMTADQIVQELKMLVQNDAALNEFQGSLQEMVDQSKDEADIEDAEDEAVEEDLADAGGATPPPDQQPMMTARKRKTDEEVVRLREELVNARQTARLLNMQLSERDRKIASLQEQNIIVKDENKLLLAERTMRIRYPRCVRVAARQVEIGEVDNEKQQVLALLRMPTEQFEATENRVGKVHQKVASSYIEEPFDTQGVLSVLPEQRGEDKKIATLVSGPRSGSEKPKLTPHWTGATK